MTADPAFAAVMAYCGPRGIPFTTFLGWSEADRAAALAWQVHESQRCSCGVHEDDTPGSWRAITVHCTGHAALDAERKAQESSDHAGGLVTRLVRR